MTEKFAHSMSWYVASHFAIVWLVQAAFLVFALIIALTPFQYTRTSRPPSSSSLPVHPLSSAETVAVGILIVFLSGYVTLLLDWSDLSFYWYDNYYFTEHALRARNIPVQIFPSTGRFNPLAYLDINIIRLLASTSIGYHSLAVAQAIFVAVGVYFLLEVPNSAIRALLTAGTMLLPSFLISFSSLIYPERYVLFLLVCLLLSVRWFERHQSLVAAALAVVAAHLMVYGKEPAFMLLLGFSLGRIALRLLASDGKACRSNLLESRSTRLDLCLAAVSVLFLFNYALVMLPHWNIRYAEGMSQPWQTVLALYVSASVLPFLLTAVLVIRGWLVMRKIIKADPFLDPLALGGAAYFATLLALRIYSTYFTAPVELIAVLYLGTLGARHLNAGDRTQRLFAQIATMFIIFQASVICTLRFYEMRNIVEARAGIAGMLAKKVEASNAFPPRVFLPFAKPYAAAQLASSLVIPLLENGSKSIDQFELTMAGPNLGADKECKALSSSARCVSDLSPRPNDLIVILPDDFASNASVDALRAFGDVIYVHHPTTPSLPSWPHVLALQVTTASPAYAGKRFPETWLLGCIIEMH